MQMISFKLDVSSLVLFDQPFDGSITRLEVWNEVISEHQILVSYRDCRKQNGDLFSWSKVSDQMLFDVNDLKNSAFCSGNGKNFVHSSIMKRFFSIRLFRTSIHSWWVVSCVGL